MKFVTFLVLLFSIHNEFVNGEFLKAGENTNSTFVPVTLADSYNNKNSLWIYSEGRFPHFFQNLINYFKHAVPENKKELAENNAILSVKVNGQAKGDNLCRFENDLVMQVVLNVTDDENREWSLSDGWFSYFNNTSEIPDDVEYGGANYIVGFPPGFIKNDFLQTASGVWMTVHDKQSPDIDVPIPFINFTGGAANLLHFDHIEIKCLLYDNSSMEIAYDSNPNEDPITLRSVTTTNKTEWDVFCIDLMPFAKLQLKILTESESSFVLVDNIILSQFKKEETTTIGTTSTAKQTITSEGTSASAGATASEESIASEGTSTLQGSSTTLGFSSTPQDQEDPEETTETKTTLTDMTEYFSTTEYLSTTEKVSSSAKCQTLNRLSICTIAIICLMNL